MQARVLKKLNVPLEWTHLADRSPGQGEIRVKILACGVCRTDLHVVDGEETRPLWIWRGGAYIGAGCQMAGPFGVRIHAAW